MKLRKYYDSLMDYCLQHGIPKKARYEIWFVKQKNGLIESPLTNFDSFAKTAAYQIILKGNCNITVDKKSDRYFIRQDDIYKEVKIKDYGFYVMVVIAEKGGFLSNGGRVRSVKPEDEISINCPYIPWLGKITKIEDVDEERL